MDHMSFELGNILLGNSGSAAGIEIAGGFFRCRFEDDTYIAITGADMSPEINGDRQQMGRVLAVEGGDVLNINGYSAKGYRCYITVLGGIVVEKFLGSRSFSESSGLQGLLGRYLQSNDLLPTGPAFRSPDAIRLIKNPVDELSAVLQLRVLLSVNSGAEFITEEGMDYFFNHEFTIQLKSGRSRIVLDSIPDSLFSRRTGRIGGHHPSNIIDQAYCVPGGVILAGNSPEILGVDAPTMGGFLCVLQVIHADFWKLGQAAPGKDRVRFTLTDRNTAAIDRGKLSRYFDAGNFIAI
jgi:allophanate hydrolase subunit 2